MEIQQLFIILRQPAANSVTVFSNWTKLTNYPFIFATAQKQPSRVRYNKVCQLVNQVLLILTSGNLLVNKTDLQALYLSGTYCHRIGTRPPNCNASQELTMYLETVRKIAKDVETVIKIRTQSETQKDKQTKKEKSVKNFPLNASELRCQWKRKLLQKTNLYIPSFHNKHLLLHCNLIVSKSRGIKLNSI